MIYLLYGQDSFSIDETLSLMKEDFGPAELRDVNITVFEGAHVSFNELTATSNTVPFLAEKRLVIVEGLLSRFETKTTYRRRGRASSPKVSELEEWERLPIYLSNLPETTDVVFLEGPLNNSNPLLSKIRTFAKTTGFPDLSGTSLKQWIYERAAKNQIEIDSKAVNTLAETIGSDLRVLDSELRKLSTYSAGRPITNQDVQDLVTYYKEVNIFKAVDAALEGRIRIAVGFIHQLIELGRSPVYILSMIARQVRLLLLTKDLKINGVAPVDIGKRLSLSGYPLRKTLEQQEKFTTSRLIGIHRRLLEADVRMKTSDINDELALDLLILDIAYEP